jgi:hypothetical protein
MSLATSSPPHFRSSAGILSAPEAERHSSLNSSRGVVSTDALDGMSDEEIQLALALKSLLRAYIVI